MSLYYDEDLEEESVVVDNGSYWCRAGFAGEEVPSYKLRTLVGTACDDSSLSEEEAFIGYDPNANYSHVMSLNRPIEQGVINNWDEMEKIWDYMFYKRLKIEPKAHNLVMSEPTLSPKAQAEKKAQVLFENYGFSSLYLLDESITSLYAKGITSGINVSIGEGSTTVTAVYEGCLIPYATRKMEMGGYDMTMYLQTLMLCKGYSFATSVELEWLQKIKEDWCHVKDITVPGDKCYSGTKYVSLPNKSVVPMTSERWMAPEMLFNPSIAGLAYPSIHQLIKDCFNTLPIDLKRLLCSRIILSGGTTVLPGFHKRLVSELNQDGFLSPAIHARVFSPEVADLSCWIGLSILGSLSCFKGVWVTREKYDEIGPSVVHRHGWTI